MTRHPEMSAIDTTALRRTLGTFATGVTVVTTVDALGRRQGLTANSFTSVSLDPPLVLVCLARTSQTLVAIRSSGVFAVNVLGADQRHLADLFASKADDKFGGVSWRTGTTGAPVLDGCVGHVDCSVHAIVEAGDHDVLLGRVRAFGQRPLRPLGYFRGAYAVVSNGTEAARRPGEGSAA